MSTVPTQFFQILKSVHLLDDARAAIASVFSIFDLPKSRFSSNRQCHLNIRTVEVFPAVGVLNSGIFCHMAPQRIGSFVFQPKCVPFLQNSVRCVSNKQRKKWKVRKYHFRLRLKRTMRKMRVPYVSSKPRGQVKKKPILFDFRPAMRRRLKRAER